ncbi:hypothetical protein CEP53_008655 [Fusarium sp. AF-6]|nr:hypothetical protein CEP53_008655 [Fusarium sp. AF-6]
MTGSEFVYYYYNPSLPAAVVFVVLFGLSELAHVCQIVHSRTWYFVPFVIGCIFEAIGYIGRTLSAEEAPDFSKIPYILQSLLLLLGPTFFAASIYMVLARIIILLQAGHLSVVKPSWLIKVFVTGDVLSFLAQSGGGGMLANAKSKTATDRAEWVIVAGLAIQIIFFDFFMLATLIFHTRIHSNPTQASRELQVPWKKLIYILYATSVFIMIRSVFRIVEYIMGRGSELQDNEFWLYVFDASLMAMTSMLFNGFHPGRVLRNTATTVKTEA